MFELHMLLNVKAGVEGSETKNIIQYIFPILAHLEGRQRSLKVSEWTIKFYADKGWNTQNSLKSFGAEHHVGVERNICLISDLL